MISCFSLNHIGNKIATLAYNFVYSLVYSQAKCRLNINSQRTMYAVLQIQELRHVTIKNRETDKPDLQIFWSRYHRIVSYTHRNEDKPSQREMNKAKQSAVHGHHTCDNEIHISGSRISRKIRIDIVSVTTLELFVRNLHIHRENRGKNQQRR